MSTEPTRTRDPLISRTLDGRYEILESIGRGSMGMVYRARHAVLGKQLAIKVLHHASGSEQDIARFKKEAQAASAVGHEHIVEVLDFGTISDTATYLVMEHLQGKSLGAYLKTVSPPVSLPVLLSIATQICEGLEAAHRAGVIHRDLKPENVHLIRHQGQDHFVKLLDFGVAKVKGSQTLTQDGQILGTPAYMSPEQCQGKPVTVRADVYALGVMLYEMITGRVPFQAEHWVALAEAHRSAKPKPLPAGTPPQLSMIVMRCLAKDPADRYPSMAQVARDLQELARTLDPSTSAGRTRRSDELSAPPKPVAPRTKPARIKPTAPTHARADAPWYERHARAMALSGLTLVALSIVLWTMRPRADHLATEQTPAEHEAASQHATDPTFAQRQRLLNTASANRSTRIDTRPVQALIYRDGELLGLSPQTIPLPPAGQEMELVLEQDGYLTHRVLLDQHSPSELSVMLSAAEHPLIEPPPNAPSTPTVTKRKPASTKAKPARKSIPLDDIRDPWE